VTPTPPFFQKLIPMTLFSHRPHPLKLDSISELPEYHFEMNLGAETPRSLVRPSVTPTKDEWSKVGVAVNSNVPTRTRAWRSLSWSSKHRSPRFQKEEVDRDCAICFDPAINPRKTSCCGQVFCYAHLADWLKSNNNCPACDSKCISPLSPSPSSSQLPAILRDRPASPVPVLVPVSPSVYTPPKSPPLMVSLPPHAHTLTKLIPAAAVVNSVVGEELGKLLMLIAFILVLCIIASPSR